MAHISRFPLANVFPFGRSAPPGDAHATVFPFGYEDSPITPPSVSAIDAPTWNFPFYDGSLVSDVGDATLVSLNKTYGIVGSGVVEEYDTQGFVQATAQPHGNVCGVVCTGVLNRELFDYPSGSFGAGLKINNDDIKIQLSVNEGIYEPVMLDIRFASGRVFIDTQHAADWRNAALHLLLLIDVSEQKAKAYINGVQFWSGGTGAIDSTIGANTTPYVARAKCSIDEVAIWADMPSVGSYLDFDDIASELYGSGRLLVYRAGVPGWVRIPEFITIGSDIYNFAIYNFAGIYGIFFNGPAWYIESGNGGGIVTITTMQHPVFVRFLGDFIIDAILADGVPGQYELPWPDPNAEWGQIDLTEGHFDNTTYVLTGCSEPAFDGIYEFAGPRLMVGPETNGNAVSFLVWDHVGSPGVVMARLNKPGVFPASWFLFDANTPWSYYESAKSQLEPTGILNWFSTAPYELPGPLVSLPS